jgi:hypothetical protein
MEAFEGALTTGNAKKREARVQAFLKLLNANINVGKQTGFAVGAMEFNRRCITELDAKIRAAGGAKSYEALTGEKING